MSIVVYKTTDRIRIKIGELEFKLAPLTFDQKRQCSQSSRVESGKLIEDGLMTAYKSLHFSVKEVKGLINPDGTEYKLSFDDNNNITQDCIDDLFNFEFSERLMIACYNLVSGIPKVIIDPVTGKPIEGVEIVQGK